MKDSTEQENVTALPAAFDTVRMPLRAVALPAEQVVHLWHLDLAQLAGALQHALAGDSHAEDERNGRKAVAGDLTAGQLRFARRFYLRLLIGAYLDLPGKSVEILRSHRGKPALDYSVHQSPLHFSMAKSGDQLLIGIAVTDHLGVDLEPLDRQAHSAMRVARRYFSAAEAEALAGLPAARLDRAFLRVWACKEAVVKASGQGIANQLCRFSVETDPLRAPAVLQIDGDEPGAWSLALVKPAEHLLGAVALRQPGLEIVCHRLLPTA